MNPVKVLLAIIAVCVFSISTSTALATDKINMNPGNWEITTAMDTTGLPFSIPPIVHTACLTENDLIPQSGEDEYGENCEIIQKSINGDTVNWDIECTENEGKITSSGAITYNGDSFTGKIKIKMPKMSVITQNVTGQRIGDCE